MKYALFVRGFVITENETYYIEPETNDLRGRHFIFKQSDNLLPLTRCGKLSSCYCFVNCIDILLFVYTVQRIRK
jgi:hypothetical protein